MNQEREKVIVAAWKERGRKEWDPETHGKGLLSLNIQAEIRMTQRGALGTVGSFWSCPVFVAHQLSALVAADRGEAERPPAPFFWITVT
jgi:hypothetical protein